MGKGRRSGRPLTSLSRSPKCKHWMVRRPEYLLPPGHAARPRWGYIGAGWRLNRVLFVCIKKYIPFDKRPDTVGEPPRVEICVSIVPALKAQRLRKLPQEKVLLELCSTF